MLFVLMGRLTHGLTVLDESLHFDFKHEIMIERMYDFDGWFKPVNDRTGQKSNNKKGQLKARVWLSWWLNAPNPDPDLD